MRCRAVPLVLAVVSLLFAACASDAPEATPASASAPPVSPLTESSGSQLLDPDGNFVLYVSNQSFELDPVDIVIEIDGEQIVGGEFEVGNQHNWRRYVLRLSPGRHTLTARSTDGDATLEESFVVSERRWAALDYWYYTEAYGSTTEPKHFEFSIYDKPLKFA
jgi:hypothetical protein